jgi:hypothetical protein
MNSYEYALYIAYMKRLEHKQLVARCKHLGIGQQPK